MKKKKILIIDDDPMIAKAIRIHLEENSLCLEARGLSESMTKIKENKQNMFDIVGPVCETGDTLATNLELSFIKSGDLLAILSAGAYGAGMSSSYNSRPIIPEVMVKKQNFSLIRNRIYIDRND